MVVHITTDDAMRERVREYITARERVSAADLAGDFGLGFMRSRSLIDEFETEGLISGPDPDFIHNVRQPNGELVQPDEGPRDPLDVTVRSWVARLILRLRGKNV